MMPPKRDMDEPVNIDASPEDAMKILLAALNDPELPPIGEPFAEEDEGAA